MRNACGNRKTALLGNIVSCDSVIENGLVVVSGGIIEYSGKRDGVPLPDDVRDYGQKLLTPGFVDIHCHGGGGRFFYEDPAAAAEFHYKHGTTALLCTLYRDLARGEVLAALDSIKRAMKTCPTILGVHMEGPYLNPAYGAKSGTEAEKADPEKFGAVISSGIVRQWTYSPETDTGTFVEDIVKAGIVPAIGHSNASPEKVCRAVKEGAGIVTHLFNATGCSIAPARFAGTKEVSFDAAALLCGNLYYELILDREGVHVRYDIARLAVKIAGTDRIVGITDHYCGNGAGDKTSDVNFVNGELTGSRLTMDNVARNFLRLGLSITDVFKIVSLNPAKAIKADKLVGSLTPGRRADILVTDYNLSDIQVIAL